MMSELTQDQLVLIKKISHELVERLAPDEEEFFHLFYDEYFSQRDKVFQNRNLSKVLDQDLALNGEEILQAILTPTVISAVIVGVSKLFELVANSKTKTQNKNNDTKSTSNHQAENNINGVNLNIVGIEREMVQVLRKWKVGKDRANLIAHEFIVIAMKDPNIFVSNNLQINISSNENQK